MAKRDESTEMDDDDDVRLDKWLWAARFFKTRALARAAVEGGKVYINGARAKPSRAVVPGQELRIACPRGQYVVTVDAVTVQRGSATVAAKLYTETEESKKAREELVAMRRFARVAAPAERPNTQDRRILRRIKEGD
jgi:ribosome-associated heat shock protein Hsp15